MYQKAVVDVFGTSRDVLHTEVTSYCRVTKCKKKVWTKIEVGSTVQEYVRESSRGDNHDGDPLQVEVDVTVDKALKMAFLNPMTTNRSIIAAVTEGISDEVRFALDIDKLGHRLSLVKMKLFPEGSTDPSNLRISDLWRTHVDGSPFVMFDSGEETGQKRMIIMSSLYMMDVRTKSRQ